MSEKSNALEQADALLLIRAKQKIILDTVEQLGTAALHRIWALQRRLDEVEGIIEKHADHDERGNRSLVNSILYDIREVQ